jgi:membrane protein required for colicin V production
MTVFDFIVLALVGASVVAGALRGLVRALLTGAALIAGLFVAARGYPAAGAMLHGLGIVESDAAASAGGFLLIMCAALVIGFIAARLLTGGLRRARLEWFDRALGAVFGFIRGLAVCSIMYLALTAFPVRITSVTEARTAPVLAEGARLLAVFASQDVRTRFLDQFS